jgi:hypothetical protein
MPGSDRATRFKVAVLAAGTALLLWAGILIAQNKTDNHDDGFTDTPLLPGLRWHVHDPARPHPKVVTPGAQPGQPPSDAVVLFDGKDLSKWTSAHLRTAAFTVGFEPAHWKVGDGYFEVVPRSGDIASKEKFGDIQLHVEWMEPADVKGVSQDRGNSGIFLMGLFEIQVLDSFVNRTYADGQAGAMYGQWPPLVNAVRKPGEWQTYDIAFEAPQFAAGKLTRPASMTVFLNGVLLHNRKEEMGPTIYRQIPKYVAGPGEGPIVLQDHGHPVRFRNIWARRVRGYD